MCRPGTTKPKKLLRLSGVAFSNGENTSCKVVDIVKQIGVEIKVADIEAKVLLIVPTGYYQDLKLVKNLRTIDGHKNISINPDITKSHDELASMDRQYVRKNAQVNMGY